MLTSVSDLLVAPWTNAVVSTAVRLDVFSICSGSLMTVDGIASRCGALPNRLERLLDACSAMGFLVRKDGKYMNTHFSSVYFVEGEPLYVGDLIKLQYNESRQWDTLYAVILGSDTRVEDSQETRHRIFIKAMHNLGSLGEAEALAKAVDLSSCTRMIDAGGGSGIYSVALCRAYPRLNATILDKKETLVITTEMLSNYEESNRITLREADIEKDSFGEDIDAVLLSDVIYNVSTAELVFRNVRGCLRKKGQLILRGYYADPEHANPLFGALFRAGELVFDPDRRVPTLSLLEEKVLASGFSIIRKAPLTERSFIVIAEKK
ncbi:MAG: methyltransferase [Bacteroidota bacterium]